MIESDTKSGEENIKMNSNATLNILGITSIQIDYFWTEYNKCLKEQSWLLPNFIILENSTGTYLNMTKAVYAYPEVQPTELRQDVDYSFYFVLMGMLYLLLYWFTILRKNSLQQWRS